MRPKIYMKNGEWICISDQGIGKSKTFRGAYEAWAMARAFSYRPNQNPRAISYQWAGNDAARVH